MSASTKALSSSLYVHAHNVKAVSSSLFIPNMKYGVARINNWVTEKSTSKAMPTANAYGVIITTDLEGYSAHTVTIFASPINDVTYKIEGYNASLDTWSAITNTAGVAQTDINLTKATSVLVIFIGQYEKVRVQAKNKTGGQNSGCSASLASVIGAPVIVTA
jgi:hypothetical protein